MTSSPDLTADSLLTRDETDRLSNILRLGRKFGLSWKEHNVGTAPLDQNQQPYQIGVYLSQDAVITTSDRLLFTVNVPLPGFAPLTLSAGDSFGWQIAAPLPDNVVPGNYFLGVIEDIGNSVQEASETNNASSGAPIVVRPIVSSDFNGDGHSDILLRSTGGALVDWTMSGPQISTAQVLTYQGNPVPPPGSWNVAGIGNFNGDQNADILMRSSDGMFVDWTMNGSEIASAQILTYQGAQITSLDSSWAVVGIGDFNGDHNADILLRSAGGTFVDWTMNGSEIASARILTYQGTPISSLDSSWTVVGVGDFNGDHNADILMRSAGGTFVDWTMNGSDIASAQILTFQGSPITSLDSSWVVDGIGDFNGDGLSDILLHGPDGSWIDWTMNGATVTFADLLTYQGNQIHLDSSWNTMGLADLNGDHKTDLLLRNAAGGMVEWTMNGSHIDGAQSLAYQGSPITSLDQAWQAPHGPSVGF